jgi:hypothetical protein
MLTPTGTPIGSDLNCEDVSRCLDIVASCNDNGYVTYCIEPKDGAPDDCKKEWSHIAVYANGLMLDGSDLLELPPECTNNLQGKLDVLKNDKYNDRDEKYQQKVDSTNIALSFSLPPVLTQRYLFVQ